jgi:hypothetical protein
MSQFAKNDTKWTQNNHYTRSYLVNTGTIIPIYYMLRMPPKNMVPHIEQNKKMLDILNKERGVRLEGSFGQCIYHYLQYKIIPSDTRSIKIL